MLLELQSENYEIPMLLNDEEGSEKVLLTCDIEIQRKKAELYNYRAYAIKYQNWDWEGVSWY